MIGIYLHLFAVNRLERPEKEKETEGRDWKKSTAELKEDLAANSGTGTAPSPKPQSPKIKTLIDGHAQRLLQLLASRD